MFLMERKSIAQACRHWLPSRRRSAQPIIDHYIPHMLTVPSYRTN